MWNYRTCSEIKINNNLKSTYEMVQEIITIIPICAFLYNTQNIIIVFTISVYANKLGEFPWITLIIAQASLSTDFHQTLWRLLAK